MISSQSAPGRHPGALCRVPVYRFRGDTTAGTWFGLLLVLLFAAGCNRSDTVADLVILNGAEPESLDPAVITGQADGRVVLSLFEGLTRYNPTNAAALPGLAERWDVSADGRAYTFHLRPALAWSTGEPLTAHDFEYSWRRILDPGVACEYAGLLFYVKNGEAFAAGALDDPAQLGFRAVDDTTFQVELAHPTPFFLELCAFPTLAAVPRQAIEKHGDRWLTAHSVPVSGSYELVSWRINDRIRLRKNRRYWDAANTRTGLVDLLPCVNANTALNLYCTGEADIVWDKNLVPAELLDVLLRRPDFHTFPYLGTYFIRFNVKKGPLADPRVRKAFALVIDKERIVERITRGGEKVADAHTPRILPGYSPPEGLGYNPPEASRLLADAGFPGGDGFPSMRFLLDTTSKLHEQIAVELQQMWKEGLGVHVELRKLEWKAYLRAQSELDYDLSRSSWIGDYNDPSTFLDMFMSNNGNNRTGWESAEYDELMHKANSELDVSTREGMLQAAETILIRKEVPVIPLYTYVGMEYFDATKIHGIHPNIRGEHPLRTIWKEKDDR